MAGGFALPDSLQRILSQCAKEDQNLFESPDMPPGPTAEKSEGSAPPSAAGGNNKVKLD